MGFEIINRLKKEKGLTNAQIAKMSGITLSTLDKITSGANTNPKLDTLQAICSVLGCTLNDFIAVHPENKNSPCTDEPTPGNNKKSTPLYSSEAMELARDYDELDSHGKRIVRLVADEEKARCEELAHSSPRRIIRAAARSGDVSEIEEIYPDELPDDNEPIP